MTTLKQIANQCNVSPSTVSLVLNKPHKISKDIRDKVYDVVIKMGYLKEHHHDLKQIGLVFNNFHKEFFGDFYSEVIYGILQKTAKLNANIRLFTDFDVDYYDIHDLQGLIFVGKTPDIYYEKAVKFKIPFVNCGHPNYRYPEVPTVYLSRTMNTINLVRFILNCGHKNIAYILGERDSKDIIRREFIDAIKENNPYFSPNQVFEANYDDIQTVEIVWNSIISSQPKITAVMCANDLLAYYLYTCARKYNYVIPEDISITGFDGIHFPRHIQEPSPSLTTVIGNRIDLGEKGLELLAGILQGTLPSEKLISLDGSLAIKNSVKRIN